MKIIESRRWVNNKTGQTASIYSACPYMNESEKEFWSIETVGYTIQHPDGRVGIGRQPFKTMDEACQWITSYARARSEGL